MSKTTKQIKLILTKWVSGKIIIIDDNTTKLQLRFQIPGTRGENSTTTYRGDDALDQAYTAAYSFRKEA